MYASFVRCAVNATGDGLKTATDAMDGFLSSVSGGMDCLPSYVEVCILACHAKILCILATVLLTP